MLHYRWIVDEIQAVLGRSTGWIRRDFGKKGGIMRRFQPNTSGPDCTTALFVDGRDALPVQWAMLVAKVASNMAVYLVRVEDAAAFGCAGDTGPVTIDNKKDLHFPAQRVPRRSRAGPSDGSSLWPSLIADATDQGGMVPATLSSCWTQNFRLTAGKRQSLRAPAMATGKQRGERHAGAVSVTRNHPSTGRPRPLWATYRLPPL